MSTKFFFLIFLIPCLISAETIVLTDKTWKNMLQGQWMVEFFAPWCPACKQFKPIWDDFSRIVESKQIKVAAIDVDQYPSLSGRFGISALPTVYYVHDGIFRQYKGDRSLRSLKKYIDNEEWKDTTPISSVFAPNSILMSLTSSLFGMSTVVKDTHDLLQEYYAWPSWVIYTLFVVGVLALGILIGFGTLQILDYFLSGSSKNNVNIPDDDDDDDDDDQLEGSDSERIMVSKKQISDESQDDEEIDIEDNNETNEDNEQTLRQRR